MGSRLDELEKSIGDLMEAAPLEESALAAEGNEGSTK
jgi:hypothetical protein